VTAAAVGAITGAVIVLGKRTIFGDGWSPDVFKCGVMLATIAVLARGKRVPEPVLVIAAAIAGLVAFPLLKE
jgi:chromate transporter